MQTDTKHSDFTISLSVRSAKNMKNAQVCVINDQREFFVSLDTKVSKCVYRVNKQENSLNVGKKTCFNRRDLVKPLCILQKKDSRMTSYPSSLTALLPNRQIQVSKIQFSSSFEAISELF